GEAVGVLRVRYNASVLQEIVSANNGLLGEGSFAVLLDSQSNVRLAHGVLPSLIFKSVVPMDSATLSDLQARRLMPPGAAEELSTNLPQFEAALRNAQSQPFFTAELATGLERGAIVNMQTQEWAVVYAQPQDVFLQPINQQVRANLIVALIAAVAVAGVAVFISSTLAGPIIRLTQTAEAIGAGNLNVQAKAESSDEIGVLARTLNRMTAQLREFIVSLEDRVAARTKDLATVAEVATVTSTILDTHKLLQEVVDLTKERFNLYHSHIYLLDEKGENLVLTAGAGEPGRIMAAEKRSIPISREQSLVARAARERRGVIVNDVTQAPDFLPNPLLPNTRSEMAVPMLVGDVLIGVFDIQSDQIGRFTDSDINIQTTLAAQIAASVQNSRSYELSKEKAEFEALVNAIGDRIQCATTLEDTLQTAIREVAVALGAARVSASLQASYQSEITGEN
ncbi:MAG: GAF domain-containing protein, partial [Chloroflexi bacterium]|nr:GAF domain-containing protein [Chloroflexota bacterium]